MQSSLIWKRPMSSSRCVGLGKPLKAVVLREAALMLRTPMGLPSRSAPTEARNRPVAAQLAYQLST